MDMAQNERHIDAEREEELQSRPKIAEVIESFSEGDRITVEFDGGSSTGKVHGYSYEMHSPFDKDLTSVGDHRYWADIIIALSAPEKVNLSGYLGIMNPGMTEACLRADEQHFMTLWLFQSGGEYYDDKTEEVGPVVNVSRPDDAEG